MKLYNLDKPLTIGTKPKIPLWASEVANIWLDILENGIKQSGVAAGRSYKIKSREGGFNSRDADTK